MSEVEIGVLGAGAWGTALAILNARAGKRVALWVRDPAKAAAMRRRRENSRLPGALLPDALEVVETFPDARLLLVCVPMQHARTTLLALPHDGKPLVMCCKGLEATSGLLPHELAAALHPERAVAVLTGPNFADEIAAGLPAAAVLAAGDEARGGMIATLRTPTLRLYGSADMGGAALGGAAKNVIAIAAGVVMGAGLGENARAALITRGAAEIARLAAALGGARETVMGLSGIGDLLLTCTGASSRNYSLGLELGSGRTLADILSHRTNVTEGVATAPALLMRARAVAVEMPLTQTVAALLAGEMTVAQTQAAVMGRALRDE